MNRKFFGDENNTFIRIVKDNLSVFFNNFFTDLHIPEICVTFAVPNPGTWMDLTACNHAKKC